jgi:Arc/MetJ-type ribon-helix-helix transcriptional regulator
MKKQTVIPRKKRGPPATGKGEPVVVRMHPPQLQAIDAWIAQQAQPFPSRPEAVRRLVELGLTVRTKRKQANKRADRAKELAAKVIDSLTIEAPDDQKASRKRQLLKGPEEFRDSRVDHEQKD